MTYENEITKVDGTYPRQINTTKSVGNSKKIIQFALTGEYIRTFSSIIEASTFHACSHVSISKACKNKTKFKNFYWRYYDEHMNINN